MRYYTNVNRPNQTLIIAAMFLGSSVSIEPASAEQMTAEAAQPLAAAPPVCLSKIIAGDGRGESTIAILVPSGSAQKLIARGFATTSCANIPPVTKENVGNMCRLAATGNRQINYYIWQKYSFTPGEYCSSFSNVQGK